ncbi:MULTISPECIES: hypothetical protein [Acinetobacter]|uniref:Uncharacterized protein n=1 Tax=Acinetobacter piscicola TaxID=2006115 RepID=A0A7S6VXY0_9GAMM|nr:MULTISPECIES: hypothetical protein [Acinetobacter]QOW46930.1 hypothetical protein G0028_14095 [Acinetobacter piscicola]
MNDFFLANNDVHINQYGQEIRQFKVRELESWASIAEPIRIALKRNYSDESIEAAIKTNKFKAISMCLLVTDSTGAQIDEMIQNDADRFIELFKDVINVNKAFFDQEDAKKSKDKKAEKDKTTWFDSFQTLISKGHKHKDILNYSFGAFLEYLKAAQRHEKNYILSQSTTMRVAYHADKKCFSNYTSEVNKD